MFKISSWSFFTNPNFFNIKKSSIKKSIGCIGRDKKDLSLFISQIILFFDVKLTHFRFLYDWLLSNNSILDYYVLMSKNIQPFFSLRELLNSLGNFELRIGDWENLIARVLRPRWAGVEFNPKDDVIWTRTADSVNQYI